MSVANNHRNSGFSLIEMLTVIILIGIIGIVALGRLGSQSDTEARGFFDDTVAAVRFAQKLAISNGCDVRVSIPAPGTSYQLFWRAASGCTTGAFSAPVPNPANRSQNYQNVNIPGGYALTPGIITFGPRGFRAEGTSTFVLSDGSTSFSFVAHQTGLIEVP